MNGNSLIAAMENTDALSAMALSAASGDASVCHNLLRPTHALKESRDVNQVTMNHLMLPLNSGGQNDY